MSEPTSESVFKTSHTLLQRVQNPHDEEAWKEFVEIYEQYIYNILRSIRLSDSDAKEMCQDIIVKLWKKIPEFAYDRDRGKFRHWLGTVIRNHANDFFNKNKRTAKHIDSNEDIELDNFTHPDSLDLDKIIDDEWKQYISNLAWKIVKSRFKETMQKVFILHGEGKSTKEIAESCNVTENTVRNCVMRIKTHLIEEINKRDKELL